MLDQQTENQEITREVKINAEQQQQLSRLSLALRGFIVVDVALILFLCFGFIFPRKIQAAGNDVTMPDSYYTDTVKLSPVDIPTEPKPVRAPKPQVISARNIPLPPPISSVSTTVNAESAANAEADLTTQKKRTT